MESEAQDSSVSMSCVSACVGDVTVSQALYRDLKTSETRQALVNKANTGVRKRGRKIHAHLTQRCNSVLTGKPVSNSK